MRTRWGTSAMRCQNFEGQVPSRTRFIDIKAKLNKEGIEPQPGPTEVCDDDGEWVRSEVVNITKLESYIEELVNFSGRS